MKVKGEKYWKTVSPATKSFENPLGYLKKEHPSKVSKRITLVESISRYI